MSRTIRIATRQSALAMWQAEYVQAELTRHFPNLTVELVPMVTQGDKILDTPLAKIGGKGLFIKELEVAMQAGQADLAVHSMKDVPMHFPDDFDLFAICPRENPLDAFVSNHYTSFAALPIGAVVGTSSLRRQAQLQAARPDIEFRDCRGNVNTRLQKLDDGQYDAIILASAGLLRLGMPERIRQQIPATLSLPAVGQGAVGIECRCDDSELQTYLQALTCPQTNLRVRAERAMNTYLEGGCQVPIAGFAELDGQILSMRGLVASADGKQVLTSSGTTELQGSQQAQQAQAVALGEQLAKDLLAQGAASILSALHTD